VPWELKTNNKDSSVLLAAFVKNFGYQFLSNPIYTVKVLNELKIFNLSPKDVAHLLSMFVQTFEKKNVQKYPFIDVSKLICSLLFWMYQANI